MEAEVVLRRTAGAIGAVATVCALGLVQVVGTVPAGAATTGPGSYQGAAKGAALVVTLGGQTLTSGSTSVSGDSSPTASATGAGELLPVLVGSQSATASQVGADQSLPQACGTPSGLNVPAPLSSLVGIGTACGSAGASIDGSGEPAATATGSAADVSVGLGTLLSQVVTAGSPLAGALQGILGSLPTLPTGGLSLSSLLTQLGASAASATGLLSVTAGATSSALTTTASTVTTSSNATGATVSLLPGVGASGAPLLSISVGASHVTAALDRGTGVGTATATPALVAVTVGTAATGTHTVDIAPGQSQTFLAGTPLASTVTLGAGSVTHGAGGASATDGGLVLDLAQGVDGGFEVDLASGTASVGGAASAAPVVPAAVPVVPVPAPTASPVPETAAPTVIPDVTVVHTGEPWGGALPAVGAAFAFGLALFYRRRLMSLVPALGRLGAGRVHGALSGLVHHVVGRPDGRGPGGRGPGGEES